MNALVIETAFLGDAIVALALASELKRSEPTVRITYLVRAGVGEVIGCSPDIDRVLIFDKRGSERGLRGIQKKATELNAMDFDTVFLLHGSRRSQALVSLLKCQVKIGFEHRAARLTHTVPDSGWSNRYERAILPLRAIIPSADLSALPHLDPPAVSSLDNFFTKWNPCVGLAPGSAWQTKQWGDDKFLELAKELTARSIGVVVIGGASEREIGERIHGACPMDSVRTLAGTAAFPISMAAMKKCSLVVANDSAPVHAAVAVGTKALALFGPTATAFGFAPPVGTGSTMEIEGLWCRPCTPHGSRECPIHTHECMERITVASVLERIDRERMLVPQKKHQS